MRRLLLSLPALAAVLGGAGALAASHQPPAPKVAACPVFPASNAWNQRVDRLPVAVNSATLVHSIGLDKPVHADFGSGTYGGGPIGIPYVVVRKGQKRAPVSFDYGDESDRGPYPLPANAPVEGGAGADGDRHVLVVDTGACRLYELFDAHAQAGGARWHAGSGAVWNLRSNHLRPRGWTSSDAAGLPIFPGLARYDEVAAGAIRHALRFTAPDTRAAYVYPARHFASESHDASLPPMGLRVRLKRGVRISGMPRQARIVAQAMKTYGMLLADNGSPWFVSGAPNRRWNNDALQALGHLHGSDFEVVDTARLAKPR